MHNFLSQVLLLTFITSNPGCKPEGNDNCSGGKALPKRGVLDPKSTSVSVWGSHCPAEASEAPAVPITLELHVTVLSPGGASKRHPRSGLPVAALSNRTDGNSSSRQQLLEVVG